MSILIIALHIVVSIALILIVLLQTGKGADMGAAFGGGSSQTLFGSTGASTFLTKLTTVAAVLFMPRIRARPRGHVIDSSYLIRRCPVYDLLLYREGEVLS